MIFLIIILAVILLIAFIAAVCTKGSSMASKQEEYLEECARHERHNNDQL